MAHPLAHAFDAAARGQFPEADGRVEVVASPGGSVDAMIGFTDHFVLAADIDPQEVLARTGDGDLSIPLSADFLHWVGGAIASSPKTQDALLVALAVVGEPAVELDLVENHNHPRLQRALRYRRDVRGYRTPDGAGMLILGRGLTSRWELAFEVDQPARRSGLGRVLARAALHLLPPGTPIWAQVAPANAASLRTVLAAGFTPVAAEVLFPRAPA